MGGGDGNTADNNATTVGGGAGNAASGVEATVSGGAGNTAGGGATVGGGAANTASDGYTTIGGGFGNTNSNEYGTVSGGFKNIASGIDATIGGGANNTNNGIDATIGGGNGNTASGNSGATVGGGVNNRAINYYATVPGGFGNVAGGQYSLAAGLNAQATHDGAFVWADTQGTPFGSTAINEFLIRASGGVGINTNNPQGAALSVNGASIFNGTVSAGGTITSPKWRAATIIAEGSWPLSAGGEFASGGGTLLISVSGSGYSTTAGKTIGMSILLDSVQIDTCAIFANPSLTHLAFVPKTFVKSGITAGFHTLTLTALTGTTTDSTDNYCVTVQELPY